MSEYNIFDMLPEREKNKLLENALYKTNRKNSYLFREGDTVDAVYLIESGSVKLTRYDSAGHEKIVGIFSDDEYLWESMLSDNSTYPYNAICLTKMTYYKILKKDFETALNNKNVSKSIISLLTRKLHDANERNMYISCESPSARIAGFLLYSDQRKKGKYLELTLSDIAGSVNLREETVSRKLREMEKLNVIKRIGKGKLIINNFNELNNFYET